MSPQNRLIELIDKLAGEVCRFLRFHQACSDENAAGATDYFDAIQKRLVSFSYCTVRQSFCINWVAL